jgi:hypothetical protein
LKNAINNPSVGRDEVLKKCSDNDPPFGRGCKKERVPSTGIMTGLLIHRKLLSHMDI